jgi:hypothetical protein
MGNSQNTEQEKPRTKQKGIIVVTDELLAWLLGIEEASHIDIFGNRRNGTVEIIQENAETKHGVKFSWEVSEGEIFPEVKLNKEYFYKLWGERIWNRIINKK